MEYSFPPHVQRLVEAQMATELYASADDLLADALLALQERNEALADIQAGMEDLEAGRIRPLKEVEDDIRQRHGFPADPKGPTKSGQI
jgi:predicted transcriptional regulator